MNFIKLISVFVITDPQNITFKFVQVQRNATACGSICAKHSNDAVTLTCLALCALVLWHPLAATPLSSHLLSLATWSRHTPRSVCKACLCSKLRCCTLHELFTMLHQIIAPLFVCTVPLLAFHTLPAVAQVTQQRAEAGGADRCL